MCWKFKKIMKLNYSILLVDDHMVVRKGIALVLKNEFEGVTLYNAENYIEAIEIVKTINLDVVLLDININGVEDIKIIKEIKAIQPLVKILIFSSHDEKQYGLRYVQQGADGYLNKFCSEETIVDAVNKIITEGSYLSRNIKEKLNEKKNKKISNNPVDSLSNREYEIAVLLVNGLGNLEISNKLNIQMSTVSTYKNRVYEKLNINNVVALSELLKGNSSL